jgi:hypothetical protein
MTRRWLCAAWAAAFLTIDGAHAQQTVAPERFRYERDVVTAGAGPQRLAIDVPLIAASVPFSGAIGRQTASGLNGLADLRLFDAAGARVPHLLIQVPRTAPDWMVGRVLPIARTEKTSGFEADLGSAQTIDAMAVLGLPAPFLKRLTLEGSGDREHWTVLAREGTLFDLPDESLRQTDIVFTSGEFRYLRVTWDDTNSGRVPIPAAVRARRVSIAQPPRPLTATLAFDRRPSEPGRSRYHIRLPGPRLPIVALALEASGGHVFRPAVVYEPRVSGGEAAPAEIGRATLTRIVRNGMTAGSLRIPIRPPAEPGLDLTIEDGANAALELTGITAEFAELPWIYFEAPAGKVVARYGNPLADPPAYDLEAVRDSVRVGSLPEARWGTVRPIVEAETPAPAPAMPEIGAPLDASVFAYSRAIPDGAAGLVAVPLDAAALAHSRGPGTRFADVRIVDASGRQVPYLVERRNEPLVVALAMTSTTPAAAELRSAPGHDRSTYLVKLPYADLPGASLAIQTSARVFRRQVRLAVDRPADRQRRDPWVAVIVETSWTHADQDSAAPALVLPVRRSAGSDVLLTIDEGDNSALPIDSIQLLLPSYRLRFFRPSDAALRLSYGRNDLTSPQYDLALLTPRVMGAEATEILAGSETAAAGPGGASFISPAAFWSLLAGAAIVLLALIVRLVRKDD